MRSRSLMADADTTRALEALRQHPHVDASTIQVEKRTDGTTDVFASIRVCLPVKFSKRGFGARGVQALEPVRFRFPSSYPLGPPVITLRKDFDQNLPHVQPRPGEVRPEPCLVDGSVDELFFAGGLATLVDQLAQWLTLAASDELVSAASGWEPARRDRNESLLFFDSSAARTLAEEQCNTTFVPMGYVELPKDIGGTFKAELVIQRVAIKNRACTTPHFKQGDPAGTGLGVICTPSPDQTQNRYVPDTVADFAELKSYAHALGCGESFDRAIRVLTRHARPSGAERRLLSVVLAVRRPFNLRDSDSDLELLCYFLRLASKGFSDSLPVLPATHRDPPNTALLARVSGLQGGDPSPYSVLGCGSLGSKLALHLSRAGQPPVQVIDSAPWTPHNAARHALLPAEEESFLNKATLLAWQLRKALLCRTEGVDADATRLLLEDNTPLKPVSVLVNATASLRVRHALAGTQQLAGARVIETALYDGGSSGVMLTEGPDRNPSTLDLLAELYALAESMPLLREALKRSKHTSVDVGAGCSTSTMRMSDARLSIQAAAMAEGLLRVIPQGALPETGQLDVFQTNDHGLTRSTTNVSASLLVTPENAPEWKIHVSHDSHMAIESESKGDSNENGGILMGLLSEAAKQVVVSRTLAAPSDSTRSPTRFTLGTRNRDQSIRSASESYANGLTWVGTWHSHPKGGDPSQLDHETCGHLAKQTAGQVAILLIWTPSGYRALLADPGRLSGDEHQ